MQNHPRHRTNPMLTHLDTQRRCEQNFKSGMLTPSVVAERRVWYEGAEIELRGEE